MSMKFTTSDQTTSNDQERRESNPQPPVLETGALPIELRSFGGEVLPTAPALNGSATGKPTLLPLDLVDRTPTQTRRILFQRELWHTALHIDRRTVVQVARFGALQPHVFPFLSLCHVLTPPSRSSFDRNPKPVGRISDAPKFIQNTTGAVNRTPHAGDVTRGSSPQHPSQPCAHLREPRNADPVPWRSAYPARRSW